MKAILIILIIIIIFIITSKCLIENFTIFHNNTNNLHKSFYKSIDSNYKQHYYIDSIPDNNLNYLNCNLDYVELNNKEKKQIKHINSYIDILIPQCETFDSDNAINDFKKVIEKTIS